jgi:addiction module HigA family antidote
MTTTENPYWDDDDVDLSQGDGFALHAGIVLKSILAERGISASALARHMGVARPGFTELLNGNKKLTAPLASKLEDALEYPAELLLTMMARHELAIAKADEANHVKAFASA